MLRSGIIDIIIIIIIIISSIDLGLLKLLEAVFCLPICLFILILVNITEGIMRLTRMPEWGKSEPTQQTKPHAQKRGICLQSSGNSGKRWKKSNLGNELKAGTQWRGGIFRKQSWKLTRGITNNDAYRRLKREHSWETPKSGMEPGDVEKWCQQRGQWLYCFSLRTLQTDAGTACVRSSQTRRCVYGINCLPFALSRQRQDTRVLAPR